MIGRSNTGTGGKVYGIIVVNYPSGSAVSINPHATKKNISATQLEFYVKEAGTYTITSTDGAQTTTASIIINASNRFSSVTLSYRLYIISGGLAPFGFSRMGLKWNSNYVERSPDVGGGGSSNYVLAMPSLSGGYSQAGYSGVIYINNMDLSAYNKVRIEYDISVSGGSDAKKTRAYIYLNNGTPSNVESASVKASADFQTGATNRTLTLSFNRGSFSAAQIGIGLCNTNFGVGGTVTIKNVYAYNE